MNETALYLLILLVAVCIVLLLIQVFRQGRQSGKDGDLPVLQEQLPG